MKNADKPINPIVQEENIGQGGKILMCTEYGLTKREHYAGLAMQGMLSNSGTSNYLKGNIDLLVPELVSKFAIEYADELLKQLEKK